MNIHPSSIADFVRQSITQAFETGMRPAARLRQTAPTEQVTKAEQTAAPAPSFQEMLSSLTSIGIPNSDINPTIDAAITAASIEHGVDANLIRAIIRAESSYNPLAVSSAGAMGLMQLMPATARNLGVTDPFDIVQNVNGGTAYIRSLLDRFNGDTELALAAYNAGWPRVQQFGGIPPFAETQTYVPRVLGFREEYVLSQYTQNADNRRR